MTRALLLSLLVVARVAAQEAAPPVRAMVEVDVDRDVVFDQQPVRISVRFGVEMQFLGEQVIQPFRQHLDVPVRIDAPWMDDLDGAAAVEAGPAPDEGARATFVLNGVLARARRAPEQTVDGRRFAMFEVERWFRPERAGRMRAAPTRLEVSYATRFRDDFVSGRVPEDRQELTVEAAERTVQVRPLPVVGRPAEFTGAVGQFVVRAEVDRRDVEVGDSLRLELTIDGEGNFATFEAPALGAVDGFHLLGRIEDRSARALVVTWDLAPQRPTVGAVPPVVFAYFDPDEPAGYRVVQSDPIPITVRGDAVPVEEPQPVAAGPVIEDIHGPISVAAGVSGAAAPRAGARLWIPLCAPWLLALGVVVRRALVRRRLARVGDGARAEFSDGVARGDVSGAFVRYLAAKLGWPPSAVVSPDLVARMAAAGVPPERAVRAGELVGAFVAARYGGGAAAPAERDARELVDAWERSSAEESR